MIARRLPIGALESKAVGAESMSGTYKEHIERARQGRIEVRHV